MNAHTGNGIIWAILCTVMEENISKFISGFAALIFGAVGIAMEVADRVDKKKGVPHGDDIPGPSR